MVNFFPYSNVAREQVNYAVNLYPGQTLHESPPVGCECLVASGSAIRRPSDSKTVRVRTGQDSFWWQDASHFLLGSPLHPQSVGTSCLRTALGWGGGGTHIGVQTTSGVRFQDERELHINILEMRPVRLGPPPPTTDNTTVMAYVNQQGGTQSLDLMF